MNELDEFWIQGVLINNKFVIKICYFDPPMSLMYVLKYCKAFLEKEDAIFFLVCLPDGL
jgi:hypothetical protein